MADIDSKSTPPRDPERRTYSGQDARGGEIILKSRKRRMIFIGGLVGIVLLVVIVRLAALA